ncbi:MAG: LysR substrate-binding domain-containing protein [Woeseiaceae bacterium]|nr:LysR substrate-binding domain-containing protein [Woeseiaceae bacterium]
MTESSLSRTISLRELRSFCLAAETGSFRATADRLFVTASTISHQIRSLEETLGVRLFDRDVRSLAITDAGRALHADLSPLLERLDTTLLNHARAAKRLALHVSVQPFFASELFMPRLASFRAEHPDIDLRIDTSDESPEKHPASADVSIRVFRHPPPKLAAEILFPLRLVPVAAPGFRRRFNVRDRQIHGDFPVISHTTRPLAWQHWEQSAGIRLPDSMPAVHADSMIAVVRAAEQGLGAALVPLQLVDGWLRSGSLARLFDEDLPTDDAYYFVCREEDARRQTVQQLRTWVLREFGSAA